MFNVGKKARLDLADDYLAAGQPDIAIGVLEDLQRRQPEDMKILVRLGVAYLRNDRREDAQTLLEGGLRRAPNDFGIHLQLASVLGLGESLGGLMHPAGRPIISVVPDPKPALEHYARAIELAPDQPDGYRGRGEFFPDDGEAAFHLEPFLGVFSRVL